MAYKSASQANDFFRREGSQSTRISPRGHGFEFGDPSAMRALTELESALATRASLRNEKQAGAARLADLFRMGHRRTHPLVEAASCAVGSVDTELAGVNARIRQLRSALPVIPAGTAPSAELPLRMADLLRRVAMVVQLHEDDLRIVQDALHRYFAEGYPGQAGGRTK